MPYRTSLARNLLIHGVSLRKSIFSKYVAVFIVLAALCSGALHAEIKHSQPPFSLTLSQALDWHETSEFATKDNVSRIPLATRIDPRIGALQANLDSHARILLAPDGMNNFGNYLHAQDTFNLYNFTNWAYIDTLNWFAGTADQTVNVPARPWVEAAHKNGVRVLGTVFLGIAQWGGSADKVERLLVQDDAGRFIAAHKLVAMAEYYGFDGWLINQETNLQAVKDEHGNIIPGEIDKERAAKLALKMQDFMRYLTNLAPPHIEIHWYDSMIMDGRVRWQNALNEKNLPFFQEDKDSPRTADAMFVNYWWNGEMLNDSAELAKQKGRSPYDVYFGADLWPERKAQRAFSTYTWLDAIFPKNAPAKTSLALFANNVNFNFSGTDKLPAYSRYQQDPNDVERFYETEQRLFAGNDLNVAIKDNEEWPGIGAHVAARSVISSLPFSTYFNTGHGRLRMKGGQKVSADDWHDIAQQDILPTWQFAVQNTMTKGLVDIQYDFSDAYNGGSSLRFTIAPFADEHIEIPLFKTQLLLSNNTRLIANVKSEEASASEVYLLLSFSDGNQTRVPLAANSAFATGEWSSSSQVLSANIGQTLTRISLQVNAGNKKKTFLLGGLHIE